MSEGELMSKLKELWKAIGIKKEKEFWKENPDFIMTEVIFDETLHHICKYNKPEKKSKKVKEEECLTSSCVINIYKNSIKL